MAISYSVANNRITVTGYTALVPCNFTDLWNADKAGTLSLHARVGIAGVDGAAVAVDRAERPADYIILGGTSGDLYITIANWNLMTNATIRITGTDRDGAAQTDDVVVNANGNFSTVKWFKTVTHTQVTVFNTPGGGSFDYDLTQGQWGVIWKQGAAQFALDCRVQVGDFFATPTWLADTDKLVEIMSSAGIGNIRLFDIRNAGHFRLGTLVNIPEKRTADGCALIDMRTGIHVLIYAGAGAVIEAYDSFLSVPDAPITQAQIWLQTSSGTFYHCVCPGVSINTSFALDIYDCYFDTVIFALRASAGTFEDVKIDSCNNAVYCFAARQMQLSNCVFQGSIVSDIGCWAITVDQFFTDVICAWTFTWGGACTHVVKRQYTFNLQVVDSNGVGIQNVTVSMVDRLGAAVFSVNTDANGDIVEQTILLGYYNQANGNVIQPAGSHSPHTVTISRVGYITRTIVYTIDRLHVEVEELLPKGPRKDIEGGLYMEINSMGDLLRLS